MSERTVITEDGLRLHVSVRGRDDAPLTVLLSHCWTADESDWHYQVTDLLAAYGRDIRVITWDHRGHGRSDRASEAACTIPHLTRDLGQIVDTCAPEGPLVVAGHSVGGMALTAIPEERPDLMARVVGAMFVSTTSGELGKVTLGLPAVAGALLRDRLPFVLANRARMLSLSRREKFPTIERQVARRFLFGRPARSRDVALVVDQLVHTPPETMAGFFRDMMAHDRIGNLSAFDDIPTTVLVGTRDLLTPPEHAAKIARGIRGARLLVAPDAGHYLPFERRQLVSDELAALLDRALARLAKEAGEAAVRRGRHRAPAGG
ncbi:alpha/beta fold hydrolase [Nocardioides albidus]|uniref:Alpha/beta fold hydrolase n=1 Tax=Nocardioides albidus TaxID=1517589 RepID=A0A5C4VL81_9ACTN|nr:alpha/beta fold hydrolase [Nocardioides albidus]TNM36562.1 alpha/beta fold hydrolase [Nocardioides albidus]